MSNFWFAKKNIISKYEHFERKGYKNVLYICENIDSYEWWLRIRTDKYALQA